MTLTCEWQAINALSTLYTSIVTNNGRAMQGENHFLMHKCSFVTYSTLTMFNKRKGEKKKRNIRIVSPKLNSFFFLFNAYRHSFIRSILFFSPLLNSFLFFNRVVVFFFVRLLSAFSRLSHVQICGKHSIHRVSINMKNKIKLDILLYIYSIKCSWCKIDLKCFLPIQWFYIVHSILSGSSLSIFHNDEKVKIEKKNVQLGQMDTTTLVSIWLMIRWGRSSVKNFIQLTKSTVFDSEQW